MLLEFSTNQNFKSKIINFLKCVKKEIFIMAFSITNKDIIKEINLISKKIMLI